MTERPMWTVEIWNPVDGGWGKAKLKFLSLEESKYHADMTARNHSYRTRVLDNDGALVQEFTPYVGKFEAKERK